MSDIASRVCGRMLAEGMSQARVIAEVVVDARRIDAVKAAGRIRLPSGQPGDRLFGLESAESYRTWVRAEVIAALAFGARHGGMSKQDLREEVLAALDEVLGG